MNTLLKTLVIFLLVFPIATSAATAVVEVNTGEESINALEGVLFLPDTMRIRGIETGNSVINLWIEEPRYAETQVTFAGITPGGFSGTYPILTVSGEFTAQDLVQTRFESITALRDDGSGTRVPVKMKVSLIEARNDATPPESFTPIVSHDPNIFDGKYFLVFATQDKESGIAQYKVREGSWGWFRDAESPYLLKHQKLNQDVYVKAIDNAGNERITVVSARVHSAWWERYGLFAILIVLILIAFAYKKQWLRFIK